MRSIVERRWCNPGALVIRMAGKPNRRLNYWQKHLTRGCTTKPGFLCLLREMFDVCMSEKSTWFNLSDGGHIENMGVYELLRRRCKFIICVDGEAGSKFMFAGQMTLVRHAQIAFGIRLEPRLDEIRFNPESGVSRSHIHLLRVHLTCPLPAMRRLLA